MLCDCAMGNARQWLDGSSTEGSMAAELESLLGMRSAFMSDTHPTAWDHMLLLAMVLQKSGDSVAAEQIAQKCAKLQGMVLCDGSPQLLCCTQYVGHLAWKQGNSQMALAAAAQGYARIRGNNLDDICMRAIVACNLVHVGDFGAAVVSLLPVFHQGCTSKHAQSSRIFESCMHMLMLALAEQRLLEECEAVALAMIVHQMQTNAAAKCSGALKSLRSLIALAVHDFKLPVLAPWPLLASIYLEAGLLGEASVAAAKADELNNDHESVVIAAQALCDKGDFKVCQSKCLAHWGMQHGLLEGQVM